MSDLYIVTEILYVLGMSDVYIVTEILPVLIC